MIDPDWTLWRSFLAVLQTGSLSQAARRLALTQPTLGRHISLLEEALGAVLFTRSNDGLRPTGAALTLQPQAETMAAAADLLTRIASGEAEQAEGRVRLTTSEFMGVAVLPPILATFRTLYPKIDIDLVMSDRNLDLLRGDADLAVRNVAPAQDALLVRKIGEAPVRLFAHQSYAGRHDLPGSLPALQDHALIGREEYARRVPAFAGLSLRFGFASESDIALLAALRAGMGIGACQQGVADTDPSLIPVLPAVTIVQLPIWMAMHEDRRRLRRLRLLFDHLAESLKAYLAG
ncbi:LysR family transcriptional regulator [Acidisoma cellulosilytica]|uniref:LysR family transcriptional regulator n=1 Tax=Acidisoma cellulosilyticum TaxID=2802395 RepID=A0A963Z4A6_9PROT|nr:LysR family transcriptional regulator [Acidisoma cellulosilyticum]MCB8882493.1 LysR family transcriptional regulator [Acidisoma cellulosilyticum]